MGNFLLEIRGTKYIYGRTRHGGNGDGVLSHQHVSPGYSHLSDCALIISYTYANTSIISIDRISLASDTSRCDACVGRCCSARL